MIGTKSKKIIVRDLKISHLKSLIALEKSCFPDPWPEDWFRTIIKARMIAWGSFQGRTLIGYLIAIPSSKEVHLANIAIEQKYRRHGIACSMIKRLYEYCRRLNHRSITLEVRRSNHSALAFYAKEGFVQTGIAKGYYRGIEDALNFKLELK